MAKNIPTLTTPRLTLRPFTLDDVTHLHHIMNEPNIMQYFPNTEPPDMERVRKIIENQLNHWDEHNLGWWAVVPIGQSQLIGWNGLQYLPETDEVEVGYLLSKQFWGRGYATEGARASIQFGFENFDFKEIIGLTHPENLASQNVLKKCGMQFTKSAEYFGIQVFQFTLKAPTIA
jgi:ribosomal-protein-alanine N-acetyltransferase